MKHFNFTYETVGNSSYLVATFDKSAKIINYQMQMLSTNKIPNILETSKKQKNDDIQIFYNVTSKLSLSQATTRQKISKQGFINMIKGAITAYNELPEYQLVSSGIVLDSDYVFVKTNTFEPSFIYLPINSNDEGIEPLKNFLLNIILKSMVEVTNDNFIHVILETLNSATLNINEISKMVKELEKSTSYSSSIQNELKDSRARQEQSSTLIKNNVDPKVIPIQIKEKNEQIENIVIPNNTPPMHPHTPKITNKEETKKPEVKTHNTKEKPNNGKKNIFLLLQIVFLAIIVVLSMSGKLNNVNGQLEISYLGGVLLALAGADFVLYREMFKNSKIEKTTNEDTKKPPVGIPNGKSPFTPVPKVAVTRTPIPNKPFKETVKPAPPIIEKAPIKFTPTPRELVNVHSNSSFQTGNNSLINEFESEDTVILTDDVSQGIAYLEYYENGLMTKVMLSKPNTLIGRLSDQVDFVVKNGQIGKIHAEFIAINGQYYVKDYNSTNGTYINSDPQRITSNQEVQISNGDKIILANSEFTLRC